MADWRLRDAKRHGALVARVLSRSWDGSPPPLDIPSADLVSVAPLLLDSPAAALAWNRLRNSSLPQPLLDEFRNAYRFSSLRSEMRAIDLAQVLAKLRSAGIEPIVHKGWASARLYPQPEMRAYSDIDLLIRPDQFEAAQGALNLPPHISCPIDLAHSEISQLDSPTWEDLHGHSRLVDLRSDKARILGPEHHLRSLSVHCLKHGAASPLWLADVAVAIETAGTNFDWELCIGTQQPQANWVRTALSLAHRLLRVEIAHTPIFHFLGQLPPWLVRSVLRRWSRLPVPDPLPRFASVLRRRTGVVEALAWRWPSGAQTTVDAYARFNRVPNLHLQFRSFLAPAKLKNFLAQQPSI